MEIITCKCNKWVFECKSLHCRHREKPGGIDWKDVLVEECDSAHKPFVPIKVCLGCGCGFTSSLTNKERVVGVDDPARILLCAKCYPLKDADAFKQTLLARRPDEGQRGSREWRQIQHTGIVELAR